MRTLLHESATLEEGSAGWELLQLHSKPAQYGDFFLVADISANAINPFIVSTELVDVESFDQQVLTIARIMLVGDKSRHIHIENNVAQTMYEHPLWQIYHWQYDEPNSDKLKEDWAYMEGLLGDDCPAYSWNRGEESTQEIIKAILA